MIKVYVPQIRDVKYISPDRRNDRDYPNFTSFLNFNKIYTSDGKPTNNTERKNFDEAVTAKFNELVFKPIEVFYQALEESKKPEEEW